jgi:hypothetical protein
LEDAGLEDLLDDLEDKGSSPLKKEDEGASREARDENVEPSSVKKTTDMDEGGLEAITPSGIAPPPPQYVQPKEKKKLKKVATGVGQGGKRVVLSTSCSSASNKAASTADEAASKEGRQEK